MLFEMDLLYARLFVFGIVVCLDIPRRRLFCSALCFSGIERWCFLSLYVHTTRYHYKHAPFSVKPCFHTPPLLPLASCCVHSRVDGGGIFQEGRGCDGPHKVEGGHMKQAMKNAFIERWGLCIGATDSESVQMHLQTVKFHPAVVLHERCFLIYRYMNAG